MLHGTSTTDLEQTIRSAVERNIGIPAMLDAYSEFVDSPIGRLELEDLESVFSAVLANLMERFPQIAAKKAATNARNDIASFLSLSNNGADRVKPILATALSTANKIMASSIAERFSRSSSEERRAIDATLRLIRRSREEIIFRVDFGKGIEGSGPEFDKFFASVRAESTGIKALRFQNLVVEKGIFNKLLLKTGNRKNNTIWVPSFFAKENLNFLIEKIGVVSEHILLARLKELEEQGKFDAVRPLLNQFVENQGVLSQGRMIPAEIEDLVNKVDKYFVLTPIELDDVSSLLEEELRKKRLAAEEAGRKEDDLRRNLEAQERGRVDEIKKQQEQKRQQRTLSQLERAPEVRRVKTGESIYLGRALDLEQLASAIGRRLPEKEIEVQVKSIGDYFVDLSEITELGVSIVGSSGSGRSTTLRRLLDGIASTLPDDRRVLIIDQKGEHRGIAWKYKWSVLGFASDVQSHKFFLPNFILSKDEEGGSELAASLLQEWCLSAGVSCTDQQRERIASFIRSQSDFPTNESVTKALLGEPELVQIGQKLARNLLSKSAFSRIFGAEPRLNVQSGSMIFDVSGRGLRDPTTKEERLIASVLILKSLLDSDVKSSLVVIEDVLDRFKSAALRKKVLQYITSLRGKGNTIIASSRSAIREFVGDGSLEILHRLSGEKIIAEELAGFKMSSQIRNLGVLVTFLPRGYAFTSSAVVRAGAEKKEIPSSAVRVEPLQFSVAVG